MKPLSRRGLFGLALAAPVAAVVPAVARPDAGALVKAGLVSINEARAYFGAVRIDDARWALDEIQRCAPVAPSRRYADSHVVLINGKPIEPSARSSNWAPYQRRIER